MEGVGLFYFTYIYGMKHITTILTIICAILILSVVFLYSSNNELKADLTNLNNTFDRRVEKEVNDAKAVTTDSLIKAFESKVPDTIIKTQIKYKYDTITDTILVYPSIKQYRWSANELERLYAD